MNLKAVLSRIYPVEETILEEYLSHWRLIEYDKNEFVIVGGDTVKHLYFVEEGVQKCFFYKDQKEHILFFSYSGSFTGNPQSLYPQKPSDIYIECITQSKILKISKKEHDLMLEKHHELNSLFRIGAEIMLVGVLKRYTELMSLTIEERFISFLKRSPHLLNKIPHKDLASYLRIDATNFSKLLNTIKI